MKYKIAFLPDSCLSKLIGWRPTNACYHIDPALESLALASNWLSDYLSLSSRHCANTQRRSSMLLVYAYSSLYQCSTGCVRVFVRRYLCVYMNRNIHDSFEEPSESRSNSFSVHIRTDCEK